jgi:hypothetical protein
MPVDVHGCVIFGLGRNFCLFFDQKKLILCGPRGLVFVREIFLEIDGFKHAKDGENQQAG